MSQVTPNRLISETSPYLKQHAYNPVDWYPWGPEALEKSKATDTPIFLSIGYSACHWCHVMEHECFEDANIAALMNKYFINIKVDREERPDLDQVYMASVQLLTGQGGWPMSVFLTPDLKPFFGGTYFPPQDRYGRPGFPRLIETISSWWNTRRKDVLSQANELVQSLQSHKTPNTKNELPDESLLNRAGNHLKKSFDSQHGGFGQAPKFPHPMDIQLLFRLFHRTGDNSYRDIAVFTLEKMADGGIYDQIGGGFSRYSTDERWLVPHFEKMLYDNALLVPCYLDAFRITQNPKFARIVNETLSWLSRELTDESGLFFSTLDADSEGVEGKFYVWTKAEVTECLPSDLAELFCLCMDITDEGNWEGANILNRPLAFEKISIRLNMDIATLDSTIRECLDILHRRRAGRIRPGMDNKCLVAWNALMVDALCQAARVLNNNEYLQMALKCGTTIRKNMITPEGILFHTKSPGHPAKIPGFLDDYAYLANGFLSLFESTFDPNWLMLASELGDCLIRDFMDSEGGGFFYTSNHHESLISRNKDWQDNAIPSGNAMAAIALNKLHLLTGNDSYQLASQNCLKAFAPFLEKFPQAAAQMLIALDQHQMPMEAWVFTAPNILGPIQEYRHRFYTKYRPDALLMTITKENQSQMQNLSPLARERPVGDNITLYRCRGNECDAPRTGRSIEDAVKA